VRTNRQLISIAAFLLLIPFLAAPATGGVRRRALTASPTSSPLAIAFLGTGAAVDAGTLISTGGRRAARSTSSVSIRIGPSSSESRGTATLRAYLETSDPRVTIRIDGVTLTTAPRVIQRHAPIGVASAHRIEVEVPVTAADGPLQASIGWEATTD
jgi:hypothetical protein